MGQHKEKQKKGHKKLKIVVGAVMIVVALLMMINIIEPKKNVEENPFVVAEGQKPMIAAHRGGGANNPENTMLAYEQAVETIGVDILESDLYLTKDGHLVYNHDAYIDRTSNVNGDLSPEELEKKLESGEGLHYIEDMTLEELRQYNFGYYFTDEDGNRPYMDVEDPEAAGVQIATVEQLFERFHESNPELLFIVEIKDEGDRGREACSILYETLQQYPMYLNRVVVGTFHPEIEEELRENYPELLRGASTGSAAGFILTQFCRVNLFASSDFACLQIPMEYDLGITIQLDKQTIIDRAHRRNIAVQYWTINDPEEMRELIELGCDCIMTDNPVLLKQVLEEG